MAKKKKKYYKEKRKAIQPVDVNRSVNNESLSNNAEVEDKITNTEPTPREYTVESESLKAALAKRNRLSSENVFSCIVHCSRRSAVRLPEPRIRPRDRRLQLRVFS